jgi:hypothetical protein
VAAVTVYPQGAVVERHALVALPAGRSQVRFSGLPPFLDETLLQASSPDQGLAIVGIAAEPASTRDRDSQPIAEAKARLRATELDLRSLEVERVILQTRLRTLRGFSDHARPRIRDGALDPAGEVGALEQTLDALRDSSLEAVQDLFALNARERALLRANADAEMELDRLNRAEVESSVLVVVDAAESMEANVVLSYGVEEAEWTPQYRLTWTGDPSEAQLHMFARIEQRTSEAWERVQLAIRSARPTELIEAPSLGPQELQLYPAADGSIEGLDPDARTEAPSRAGPAHLAAALAATVTNDGSPSWVPVLEGPLPMELQRELVPEQLPQLAVVGRSIAELPMDLPAGPVLLSGPDGPSGEARIEATPRSGSLAVVLDTVRGVYSERTPNRDRLVAKQSRGGSTVHRFEVAIVVVNGSAEAQRFAVHEAVPTAVDPRVRIDVEAEVVPTAFDESTGRLRWDLALSPGERAEISLSYEVEAPDDLGWFP